MRPTTSDTGWKPKVQWEGTRGRGNGVGQTAGFKNLFKNSYLELYMRPPMVVN